jgi:hypothetical protein
LVGAAQWQRIDLKSCGRTQFVCGKLHLAILRQLHNLSPLALSGGQMLYLLRGCGFYVCQRTIADAVGDLVGAGQVERCTSNGRQLRYRIFYRPWEDGR